MRILTFLSTLLMVNVCFASASEASKLDPLEEEFAFFVRTGSLSLEFGKRFAAHMAELSEEGPVVAPIGEHQEDIIQLGGHQEDATQLIRVLEELDTSYCFISQKSKNEARASLITLARDITDLRFSILYVRRALNMGWSSETALSFAGLCRDYADMHEYDVLPVHITQIAYQGFRSLHLQLGQNYDFHKKLKAGPLAIDLLEILKRATTDFQTMRDCGLMFYSENFPENCIPAAQARALLTVVGASPILVGDVEKISTANLLIYENGLEAIDFYAEYLEGSTTPAQREFYQKSIISLICNVRERAAYDESVQERLRGKDAEHSKLLRRCGRALSRLYEDRIEEKSSPYRKLCLIYKRATFLRFANKEKALELLDFIKGFDVDLLGNSFQQSRGTNLQLSAEHLRLQLTAPQDLLAFEVENEDYF